MTIYYQLIAKGLYKVFDGRGAIICKRIFTDKSAAENYVEQFKIACSVSTSDSLGDLRSDSIKVSILELELDD